MINTSFHKVAAVAIASIVGISSSVFGGAAAGHAVPTPTPTKTATPTPTPTKTPTPTPTPKPTPKGIALVKAVAEAYTQVGNALAAANASAISPTNKLAVVQAVAKAYSVLGNATAFANGSGSDKAVAKSLADALRFLEDARSVANSDAKGDDALARALAKAIATAPQLAKPLRPIPPECYCSGSGGTNSNPSF